MPLNLRKCLGLDSEAGRANWDDRIALLVGAAAIVVIVGAVVGAGVMFVRLFNSQILNPNQNPIDMIFASRLMIGAIRLALLFIGVYVVLSILAHMRRGQWLTGTGPLKVMEATQRLRSSVDAQEERVAAARAEADRLRSTVSELGAQLRTAEALLARARTRLEEED